MWVYLGILSALLLGFYEIGRKHAVDNNAVLPVLWSATTVSAAIVLPVIVLSHYLPDLMNRVGLYVPLLPPRAHFLILIKSAIVCSSWTLGFIALKRLPISIFTPIRSTSPFWTLIGAILIFHERPTGMQWVGLTIILISYYGFSLLGSREGISFRKNKWIYLLVFETIIGSVSGLYDKYLIQSLGYTPIVVLVWFSFYIVMLYSILCLVLWLPNRKKTTPFKWRWSIPVFGAFLTFSDFFYFRALSYSAALIALLIAIRRLNVLISFGIGGIMFKETNKRMKFLALSGVLAGIFLIIFNT